MASFKVLHNFPTRLRKSIRTVTIST